MDRNIIICDLDGTAALMDDRNAMREKAAKDGLSKKKQWAAFNELIGKEPVNIAVFRVLWAMKTAGFTIIYLSGRSGYYKERTQKWLNINNFPSGELRMRAEGDNRKDSIIKKELTDGIDLSKVLFCLDDRNQVVDLWRKELNLNCFQVNYGDF